MLENDLVWFKKQVIGKIPENKYINYKDKYIKTGLMWKEYKSPRSKYPLVVTGNRFW